MQNQWKFGIGQTDKQERREIRDALAAGQGEAYERAREGSRMIEEETARRRARKAARRMPWSMAARR